MLVCANESTLKIVCTRMITCNHQSSLRLNEYSILKSHDLAIPLQRGGYISSTPVSLMPRSFFAKKKKVLDSAYLIRANIKTRHLLEYFSTLL